MKARLFYNSINPRERVAAKLVESLVADVDLVDLATDTRFRESPSRSAEADRPLRALPCLVLDSKDGEVELERAEETLNTQVISGKVEAAGKHEKRLKTALAEARRRKDARGHARPILLNVLREQSSSGKEEV